MLGWGLRVLYIRKRKMENKKKSCGWPGFLDDGLTYSVFVRIVSMARVTLSSSLFLHVGFVSICLSVFTHHAPTSPSSCTVTMGFLGNLAKTTVRTSSPISLCLSLMRCVVAEKLSGIIAILEWRFSDGHTDSEASECL